MKKVYSMLAMVAVLFAVAGCHKKDEMKHKPQKRAVRVERKDHARKERKKSVKVQAHAKKKPVAKVKKAAPKK